MALTDAVDWNDYTASKHVMNVFFGGAGVAVNDGTSFTTTGWDAAEIAAAKKALANFSAVANIKFNFVNSIAAADYVLLESPNQGYAVGNLGYWGVGGGSITYGGASHAVEGWGVFNSQDPSWTPANLAVGAYGYVTLIHEIGHGLGLSHPHDNGSVVMQGVSAAFGDYGDFNLNQGIYTTMSYNDGWHTAPHVPELNPSASTYGFGWQGTLMALDIAVLQEKYGANMTYRKGNDTYTLPSANAPGTFYQCLWDAGGNDTIRHAGAAKAVIDLRAATLDYSATGGGVVSYVQGIYGGFTIAHGVVIENAIGGAGDDTISGNGARNRLSGAGGRDTIDGAGGDDVLVGGAGGDNLRGGAGSDTASYEGASKGVVASLAAPSVNSNDAAGDSYSSIENLTGSNHADRLTGNAGANVLAGGAGADTLGSGAGNDKLYGGAGKDVLAGGAGRDALSGGTGNDVLSGGTGGDRLSGGTGSDRLSGGTGNDVLEGGASGDVLSGDAGNDRLSGGTGSDRLSGGAGRDTLSGGTGNDLLAGGTGRDVLSGGAGRDIFLFDTKPGASNVDRITDFNVRDDAIRLENGIFKAFEDTGRLAASMFVSNKTGKAQDDDDHIVYRKTTGDLFYDSNGDGRGGSVLIAELSKNLSLTHNDFFIV
ncbi:M10 family metallopeptidase C-terminal domain-containing protein [Shinella pollutisoli]|uniref:M10 family metallopeptidase C-terminal domain-containing protein n=1 Tax=Shinella pollutisoli TaxID=2250594 RepID=A0ABV7DDL5_9HYPH|nr:M10 family metallopeptidase C-terminal domain-containing protein [Shinella pollutisoli]